MLNKLQEVLETYQKKFSSKIILKEAKSTDLLMDIFSITPKIKKENMQYWGRELRKCWEKIVQIVCEENCKNYSSGLTIDRDGVCDCIVGKYAIDTKYRVGSGDSGTLKKFKQYGKLLTDKGYIPVMVLFRDDNLSAAITAMKTGGWNTIMGSDSFEFINEISGFDIYAWLVENKNAYQTNRS